MDEKMSQAVLDKGQNLISVLNIISSEDYSVSDDTILDKLFVNLEKSAAIKDVLDLLYPEIVNWLQETLYGWSSGERKLFHGVKTFIFRFIGYICSTVKGHKILQEKNIPSLAFELVKKENAEPSLVVAFIDSLRMLLKHHDGYIWVTNTKIWRYAVTSYYESKSIYIKRASLTFTSSYLTSSSAYGTSSVNIFTFICEPLIENNILIVKDIYEDVLTSTSNEEKTILFDNTVDFKNSGFKCASYLCEVFEDLSKVNASLPTNLFLVYQTKNGVEESVILSDVLSHSSIYQRPESEIFSLLLIIIELNNGLLKKEVEPYHCGLVKAYSQVVSLIKYYAAQFNFKAINNICVYALRWRAKLLKIHKHDHDMCSFCDSFKESIMYFVTACFHLHICCFGNSYCFWKIDADTNFHDKLQQLMGMDLLRAYSRECCCVKNANHYLSVQYIQSAVLGLRRCLPYLRRRYVSLLVRDVVHTLLAAFTYYGNNRPESYITSLLVYLLHLAGDIIEWNAEFTIVDTTENRDLYVLVLKILNPSVKNERITITALQVLNKIVKTHLLSGVLFADDNDEYLIPYAKDLSNRTKQLDSVNWEIRDTTLEVYQNVIELGQMTAPFVRTLFDDSLLKQILNMASNDESSYVRASALNFYSSAVRTTLLDHTIPPTVLCDLALHIVLSDRMPLVRQAACNLISALYVTNVQKPLCEENRMYEVMLAAIMNDLNWEVKNAALNFWQCTIDKHLMEENVPIISSILQCSKIEQRKDVTVQIIRVFKKLSEIGCLKAIWRGVTDISDITVCNTAENIIEYLEKIDKQWNISCDFNLCDLKEPGQDSSSPMHFSVQQFAVLFFEDKKWKETLESRRQWIKSCDNLSSILSDIMSAANNKTGDHDHNAVDCY
uniref:Uncharacterized protein n=1 Tax=Homalodisca liturata TaxID=320908 RepID=A0A1B6IT38_9HEMI